jgi:hypothetical protein
MLVQRGNCAAADAGRWRGLPVPGLFAQDGSGANFKYRRALTDHRRHCGERSDEAIHSCFAALMDCFAERYTGYPGDLRAIPSKMSSSRSRHA